MLTLKNYQIVPRTCSKSLESIILRTINSWKASLMSSCPSDISKEQFSIIKPILESSRKKTCPRSLDLYEVFCAVLYALKSGCQWRMLPKDFPKWCTCHYYFSVWSERKKADDEITLDQVLKKISRRKSYFRWEEEDKLSNYRCSKCKKYRHSKK